MILNLVDGKYDEDFETEEENDGDGDKKYRSD